MTDSFDVGLIFEFVMREWSLYDDACHMQCVPLASGGFSVAYCGRFDGAPFSASMRIAKNPPNMLVLEVTKETVYIITIQVEKNYRGKGYGEELYDLACRVAKDLGIPEVRQFPSGSTIHDETRESYLLRRGWVLDEKTKEVFKKIEV